MLQVGTWSNVEELDCAKTVSFQFDMAKKEISGRKVNVDELHGGKSRFEHSISIGITSSLIF